MSSVPEAVVDLRGERPGAASDRIVQAATACGYSVVAVGPGSFRIARSRRPTWTIVMAILFGVCLVGLLFLLVKTTESAVITVYEDRTGTKARIVGVIDERLASQIIGMSGTGPTGVAPMPVDLRPTAPVVQTIPPPVTHAPPAAAASAPVYVPPPAPAFIPPPAPPAPPAAPASSGVRADPTLSYRGDDATVTRPPRQSISARVAVRLPDGRLLPVTRPMLIGRNPDGARLAGAEVVVLLDHTLSKTHLSLTPHPSGVVVTDLHSTNGTRIVGSGEIACLPDQQHVASVGTVVRAGDVELAIAGLG